MVIDTNARPKPFVGRAGELAQLRECWADCRAARARVVSVEGGALIGKTALVRRFLADAAPPRVIHLRIPEHEAATPWALLHRLARHWPAPSRLTELTAALSIDSVPHFVGQGLAEALTPREPWVLVLDNVHRADRRSADAVREAFLARHDDPWLLVLVQQVPQRRPAGRDEASQPPPAGLGPEWRDVLDGEGGLRIRLGGLSAGELRDLAAAVGHPELPANGAARLHAHTGGNPEHALHLLRTLDVQEIINGEGPLPAPADAAEALLAELDACPASTVALAEAGAVLGSQFGLGPVTRLLDASPSPDDVALALRVGALEEAPGSGGHELAFPSTVIRSLLYHRLPVLRRRELHRRAALLNDSNALWHRYCAAVGRDDEPLARELSTAAREELARGDMWRAATHARQALQVTPAGPRRRERLLTAVEALLVAGDVVGAADYEREVLALDVEPWRDYVAGYQILLQGEFGEARERLLRALAALDSGAPAAGAPADLKARVATQLAISAVLFVDYEDGIRYGELAVRSELRERWVASFAWFAWSLGLALTGRSEEALHELARAHLPGSASGLDGLVARGMLRLWTDRLGAAEDDLRAVVRRATAGEALRVGQALGFLGEVLYRRGKLGESAAATGAAVAEATARGRVWDLALLNALATYPRAAMGDWDEAREYAGQAAAWAEGLKTTTGYAYAAGARLAIAQARDDAEEMLAAAEGVERVYDSREPGTHLFGPAVADALARLGRVEEAERALKSFRSGVAGSPRRSTAMTMTRVDGQLAAAAGDGALAARSYAAALAAAEDLGLPLEAGRIELLLAQVECRGGKRRRPVAERHLRSAHARFLAHGADAYVAQALRRAAECGIDLGARNPLDSLSPFDQEIAGLAAQGRTNQAIATAKFLHIKTVEKRLSHVYAVLGVEGRAGLRRFFS